MEYNVYGLKQSRRQHWISIRTLSLSLSLILCPRPEPDTHGHWLCLYLNCSIYNLYSVLERCADSSSTCAHTKWISHQVIQHTHAKWIILRNSVPRLFSHVRKFEFAVCAVLRIDCISLSWNLHDKCVIRLILNAELFPLHSFARFDCETCSRSLRTAELSQHIQSSREMHAQLPPRLARTQSCMRCDSVSQQLLLQFSVE